MRSPPAFLQTRIARRVFGLFLMCAVLPTVTIATASYLLVTRELRQQARTQLAQASKVSGTLLLARLQGADDDLSDLLPDLRHQSDTVPEPVSRRLARRFVGLAISDSATKPRPIWGAVRGPMPAVAGSEARAHLAAGRGLLVVAPRGRVSAVYLVRALSPATPGSSLVWGELSPVYLWSDGAGEPLAPSGVDLWVFAFQDQAPLYSSAPVARRIVSRPWEQGQHGFSVEDDEGTLLAGSTTLFLGFDFGIQPWTLMLVQPATSFSAQGDFRRSILLTLALGIWLVILASNVLLRHRLDPVARLQEGTRRLADGDFSVSVKVGTGDELEQLAESFNTMAGRLRDQFALLGILQEVDRTALVARTNEQIIHATLRRVPELIPCAELLIAVGPPSSRASRLAVWRAAGGGPPRSSFRTIPQVELQELAVGQELWYMAPEARGPALLKSLEVPPGSARLLLPLRERGVCFGVIVLVAPAGSAAAFGNLEVERARQIADQVALALANTLLVDRMKQMSWGTLEAFARTIDASSPWTAGHSERVTRVALALAKHMGLSPEQLERLHRGGLLHDVGKIGVPRSILDKPDKLDPEEVALVRSHPELGAKILEPIQPYEDVIPIVRHHHERFDGTGYPDGLAGLEIPFLARVLTVADVYDALVSDRPYRTAWESTDAVRYIAERAGIEFDPVIAAAFVELTASPAWIAAAAVSAPAACSTRRMMTFVAEPS